jgi:hypothetical protein
MEPSFRFKMRRRGKILASATTIAVLLVIAWVALLGRAPVSAVSLSISTNAPKADHTFFTAYLTNNTGRTVVLPPLVVQLEEEYGRVLNNMGEMWVDTSGKQMFTMPPQSFATVSPQADSTIRRLRVIAEYDYEAGVVPRFISRRVRKLNLPFLPQGMRYWMASHGYVDGRVHGRVVSDWMQNPMFEHSSRSRRESWVPASNPSPERPTNGASFTNYGTNRAR